MPRRRIGETAHKTMAFVDPHAVVISSRELQRLRDSTTLDAKADPTLLARTYQVDFDCALRFRACKGSLR